MVFNAFGQSKTITGVITDKTDGQPVIGATVQVKGTSGGTATGHGWQLLNKRRYRRYCSYSGSSE